MITARNYAAQAELAYRQVSQPRSSIGGVIVFTDKERSTAKAISELIGRSVHFVLPDGCKLLDARGSSLVGQPLNLPYPEITIEYWSVKYQAKYLVIARQADEGISVTGATYWKETTEMWMPCSIVTLLEERIQEAGAIPLAAQMHLFPSLSMGEDPDPELTGVYISALVELLEALSCRNVIAEPIEKAKPSVNAKRIKAGKLPIYETRVLTIKPNDTKRVSGIACGPHASPRQHLRRGHIRRLENGNIWVNSCVVGDPTKGVINKQYAVV